MEILELKKAMIGQLDEPMGQSFLDFDMASVLITVDEK